MSNFGKIISALAIVLMIFFLWRGIRSNPQWLSKENLSKSFGVLGVLALALIIFIGLCVFYLRQT